MGSWVSVKGGNLKSAGSMQSMQILLRFIRDKTVVCCPARSTGTQQTPRDDFIDLFDKMGGIPSCSVIRSESAALQHRMQVGDTSSSHFRFGSLGIAVFFPPHPAHGAMLNCS